MMVLLSVKKKYCDLIMQGTKQFEFRKRLPGGLQKGDQVALYCTQPTSMVVAYVDVADVIQATPQTLWKRTSFAAGITHKYFSEYFDASHSANAIQIGEIHKLKKPLSLLSIRGNATPPQSFLYLSDEEAAKVRANTIVVKRNITVFIGGVHGVGKTMFLDGVLKPLGFATFSASDLIKRHKQMIRKDKTVSDIAGNQKSLIVESSKEAARHRLYALDGHFTLLSSEREVQPIPIEVFASLNPNCMILLLDSCEQIQMRLMARDGTKWSKALINSFLREEDRQATKVAASLRIPLFRVPETSTLSLSRIKAFIGDVIQNKFNASINIKLRELS